ncbi:type II toxin-antitoxin system HicB family antitoxin [Candidatus Desulfofervidus auxilii]|uniref:type II toxin-antitoxin system HicB family antitoxin n=1 Tax=Desulfofervidus auxilii TaxID=1621989 RepID=UPI003B967C67
MNNIKDAVKLYLESLLAHDESIPEEDITIKPLKVISYNFCKKRVALGCPQILDTVSVRGSL